MTSRIFRFYSLEPEGVFGTVDERWRSAIVRRSGWKVGGSAIFYVAVVLDDFQAADEFEQWLVRNAPRRNIRRYVARAGCDKSGAAYEDVQFHRGGLASRAHLSIDIFRRNVGRHWLGARRVAFGLWPRFRS